MIRKQSSMEREVRSEMRGGRGEVTIEHLFKADELSGQSRLVGRIVLNPGCSIGLHEHDNEEEIYYLLKGRAQIVDSGVTETLEPGDAVLTGGGASHSIENVGDQPLELLALILTY